MKYAQLLKKFQAGQVEETDLDGVDAEDWLKVREEAGEGLLNIAVDALAAFKSSDKADGKVPYVFVSDGFIPPFNDKVEANAWDLREFKYRGSMVLWDHNIEQTRPPIGTASNVKKNQPISRQGRSFKALTGDVKFADKDLYPFAGMVSELVDAGLLRGGSVGFSIEKARSATEEEQESGFKPYSSIIQKASLFEYSITPIGRDENAQRLSAESTDPLEQALARFAQEGIYDGATIGEFREDMLQSKGSATRVTVPIGEITELRPSDAVVRQLPLFVGAGAETFTPLTASVVQHNEFSLEPSLQTGLQATGTATETGNGWILSGGTSPEDKQRIEALESVVETLRAEVAELRDAQKESITDFYDELLFAAADEDTPEIDAPDSSTDAIDPLLDAATQLGFAPDN